MHRISRILLITGFSLLAFSALAATQAFAVKSVQYHECKLVAGSGVGTSTRYSSSTCTTPEPTGAYQWKLASGRLIETDTDHITTSTVVAGVKTKFECGTVAGSSQAENTAEAAVEKELVDEFGGCKVLEPAGKGCSIPETLTTNELKSETVEDRIVITPASGSNILVITVSGCSVSALNGEKQVTGSISGDVNKENSTTIEFTATSGSAVKIAGQNATYTAKSHKATASDHYTVGLVTP